MNGEKQNPPGQREISSAWHNYNRTNKRYAVFMCAFMHHFLIGSFNAMISIMFVDIVREFNANRSEASLMQSLARGFMFAGGSVGELMMRKLGFTRCILGGCLISSVCLFASAYANDTLTIVVLIGVGTGSGFMMPLLSTYIGVGRAFDQESFPKFMAYMVAGGGIGAIVSPYIAEILIEEYGWRGMCILMSGLFSNSFVFTIGMHFNLPRCRDKVRTKKRTCDVSVLKKPMYLTYLIIVIPYGLTGFIESWYVPDYLVTIGYTREQGSILLTVIGVSSTFGRLLAGLAHPICIYTKTYIIYHWLYLFLILAAAHAMFPLFPVYEILFAASVMYGLMFGMTFSQCSPIIREAVGGNRYPFAQGLHNTVYGISTSVGGVVAGSITDTSGSYDLVFYLSAIVSVFSSFCVLCLISFEFLKRRLTFNKQHVIEISHL